MRDIKLRVWDEGLQEMIYFNLNNIEFKVDIELYDKKMQYTGLKDKNDRGIYEGDILGIKVAGVYSPIGIVKYCDTKDCIFSGQYYLVDDNGHATEWAYEDEGKPEYWHHLKVKGNQYENPEFNLSAGENFEQN